MYSITYVFSDKIFTCDFDYRTFDTSKCTYFLCDKKTFLSINVVLITSKLGVSFVYCIISI